MEQALGTAVVYSAWLVCGLYFIASMFFTQRIATREKGGARLQDKLLLWGGYVLLFALPRGVPYWSRPVIAARWQPAATLAGVVLVLAGLAFTCWARKVLGRYWSGIVAVKQDHRLVTSGPYQWVRHPLYTGLLGATLGAGLVFAELHALVGVVMLWAAFIGRAHREDALMAGQFGEQFTAYQARTGRLAPRF